MRISLKSLTFNRLMSIFLFLTICPPSTYAQTNTLLIPPELFGPSFSLTMQTSTKEFIAGETTDTYGFNGDFLGPTLRFNTGDWVNIDVTNNIGEASTVHWHGMHVPPEDDGGPHSLIENGATWSPEFEILDQATTFWYHPHRHGFTEEHVYYGLAGMIIVNDDVESALTLPREYGVDDIPIILQDRSFLPNGNFRLNTGGGPGMLGDIMLINGTVDPIHETPAQMVRFRLLNGSSARVYYVGVDDDRNFHQIGSDGGLLSAPVELNRVRIAPGERMEIVIDFSADLGDTIYLRSYATELTGGEPGTNAGGPGLVNPLNGVDFDLVALKIVTATANAITELPATLITHTPWEENEDTVTRTMTLGPGTIINGVEFDHDTINETVTLGATEIWEITNSPGGPHPFHIHDIQFYILDRDGDPPPLNEQGKKDVVMVYGGETVRFITQFDHFTDPVVPYMYHCHYLGHEDQGMMGQFAVSDTTTPSLNAPTPDTLEQGQTISLAVSGTNSRFTSGFLKAYLQKTGEPDIDPDTTTATNDLSAVAEMTIPADATVGTWDLIVRDNTDNYLTLENAVTIDLGAPATLSAAAISSSEIDLSWTNVSGTQTQVLIERQEGSSRAFSQIASVNGSQTTYEDTGLSANQEYCYRIRATDGSNNSAYTSEECATTQSAGGQTLAAIDILSGWNMLGLPLSVADSAYTTLFPNALSNTLFGFNGFYFAPDPAELTTGIGYWLRFPAAETASITGTATDAVTLNLLSGWNMVAGASCDVALTDVSDPENIIVDNTLFLFSGTYIQADSIKQGAGYWLRTDAAGSITISCTPTARSASDLTGFREPTQLSEFASLQFEDADGLRQTLYIASDNQADLAHSFSLPPAPPTGVFDIRYADDSYVTWAEETPIRWQAVHFPLTITLDDRSETIYSLEELHNTQAVEHPLIVGEAVTLTDAGITGLQLRRIASGIEKIRVWPNYPNPFNPVTTIHFSLAKSSPVTIGIYNAAGQRIKIISQEIFEAGLHDVRWDGQDEHNRQSSSGVYYFGITTEMGEVSQKMILLK